MILAKNYNDKGCHNRVGWGLAARLRNEAIGYWCR